MDKFYPIHDVVVKLKVDELWLLRLIEEKDTRAFIMASFFDETCQLKNTIDGNYFEYKTERSQKFHIDVYYDYMYVVHSIIVGYHIEGNLQDSDLVGRKKCMWNTDWAKRFCHPITRTQKNGQLKLLCTTYRFIISNPRQCQYDDEYGQGEGVSYCMIGGSGDGTRSSTHVHSLTALLSNKGLSGRIFLIDPRAGNTQHEMNGFEIITISEYVEDVQHDGHLVTLSCKNKQIRIALTHLLNDAFLPGKDSNWEFLQSQMMKINAIPICLKQVGSYKAKCDGETYQQYFTKTETRLVLNGNMRVYCPASKPFGCGCSSCEDLLVCADGNDDTDMYQIFAFVWTQFCVFVNGYADIYSTHMKRALIYGCKLHDIHRPDDIIIATRTDGLWERLGIDMSIDDLVDDVCRWVDHSEVTERLLAIFEVVDAVKIMKACIGRMRFQVTLEDIDDFSMYLPEWKSERAHEAGDLRDGQVFVGDSMLMLQDEYTIVPPCVVEWPYDANRLMRLLQEDLSNFPCYLHVLEVKYYLSQIGDNRVIYFRCKGRTHAENKTDKKDKCRRGYNYIYMKGCMYLEYSVG
jgi:hypothetical protein